ncbi:hypothetical protein ACFO4E_21690 [Nocardiopsis mangrovi]|uniref:Uncharacterized protein n=1 Tax=Nocardiopsis mangrovi TaxID=1179818 RepID=A0ABV9DZZ0_9ACTN
MAEPPRHGRSTLACATTGLAAGLVLAGAACAVAADARSGAPAYVETVWSAHPDAGTVPAARAGGAPGDVIAHGAAAHGPAEAGRTAAGRL